MKMKICVTVASLAIFANMGAQAATLSQITGPVFTRSGGSGFHQITSPTQVSNGDTVMAGPQGSAQIVFDDGSVLTVAPGQVVTVPESGSAAFNQGINPTYAVLGVGAAVGIGVGVYVASKDRPASP
jgi:hypothetical protein